MKKIIMGGGKLKLKNKAFTLIELLAVIVILAIIALIAVPIILNIINDTKKSSVERSKELYIHAVEIAIANKNLNENFDPSICTVIEDGKLNCDVGELKVEVSGQLPKIGGTVTLKDGEVIGNTLEFEGEVKNDTPREPIGKAVTAENKTIAGNIPQGNYEPGDEYIINVDGEHEYHFYVLSTEGDKVDLIMSKNICSDGTYATSTNKCLVAWVSKVDYNDDTNYGNYGINNKGPITAMNYLHEATKNWNNIENIQMNYTDEGNIEKYGYGTIITTGSTTKITTKEGIETARYENLKARLPKLSDFEETGCTDSFGSCPAWIVNGLSPDYSNYSEGTKEDIEGISGYWSLSSNYSYRNAARFVNYQGSSNIIVSVVSNQGLRPVITVLKSDIS